MCTECPTIIMESLERYVKKGIPTGQFLRAVLENDLFEAYSRADDNNRAAMFEIVSYIYNELPSNCHGGPEIVASWLSTFRR